VRLAKCVFVLLVALVGVNAILRAQTSTSAVLVGTVTDMSAAVVSGAHVTLTNTQTGAVREQDTGAAGAYTFPNVAPGTYTVSVTREGFKGATVQEFTVDVSKSYTVDVALEVGSTATRVEVSAAPAVELQTTDATIGDVLAHDEMVNLPSLRRDAIELLTLQPGATPLAAQNDRLGESGGSVSGARSDQNAVILDGIDISDIFNAGTPASETVVPMNVEALSEFRVGVANPNATAASAGGGQVSVASKAGTNAVHGTVYWYIQNTAVNANSWENNHTINPLTGHQQPRAPIHDNRGGFALGGPIKKDKTFFFVNYEPRRFVTTYGGNGSQELYLPSADFRNGIINFTNPVTGSPDVACLQNAGQAIAAASSPHSTVCSAITPDSNGARISSNCGPTANQTCDPRGLGMSPSVAYLMNQIKPLPNDPGRADGVGCAGNLSCQNLSGYLFNSPAPTQDDAFNVRLDHNFNENLHFFGRYAWFRELAYGLQTPSQVDLTTTGSPLLDTTGSRGDYATVGLDWSMRNNLVNSLHFGWIRQRIDFGTSNEQALANRLKIPGTQDASGNYTMFEVGNGQGNSEAVGMAQPIMPPATNGVNHGKNIQITDDLNWIKGTHTFTFGGDVRWQPTYVTADIGQGGVSTPRIFSDQLGSSASEPGVDNGFQIQHLYDSMLGLVYQSSYYQALNTSTFQPVSGHPIADLDLHTHSLYFFAQDSWRVKPSLTFTYGLAWGVQSPYTENQGRGMVLVDTSNNKAVDAAQYLATKKAEAVQGINFNPTYGYVPYQKLGMSGMWNTDWNDWAPRASVAWSPSADSGLLGRLFGHNKTVIRTGYALVYDRLSGGVIAHLSGQPGFNSFSFANNPPCNFNSAGGPNCTPGSNDPAQSVFRMGVDGVAPFSSLLPVAPPTATSSYVPGVGGAGTVVFMYDPNYKMGQNHMIDFSIQRELPGNMIMEMGYIGRLGRHLPNAYELNSDPYMFTVAGQSFAQANDCIAQTLRYGGMKNWPAMPKLGGIPCQDSGGNLLPQPWFENMLPCNPANPTCGAGATWGSVNCGAGVSNTQCIANQQGGNFATGNIGGVFGVFAAVANANCGPMGQFASTGGAQTLAQSQQCSLFNTQENDLSVRTSNDLSNYHALWLSLRNRGWHGFTFDLNYTFSKSLDQGGRTQSFGNGYDDSFNPNAMYGPSYFDRTHVFNAVYNYELPFGPRHRLNGGNNRFVQRLVGGWFTSGVFRAMSGLPLVVAESGFTYGGGLVASNNVDMIPIGNDFSTGLFGNTGATPNDMTSGTCANYVSAMGGGGTGVGTNSSINGYNYFSNPAAAYCSFRPILLSADTRDGRDHPLRGFPFWNLDASFGKETAITERFKLKFSADFFNIFNQVSFDDPLNPLQPTGFIDATSPAQFGVITNSFTPAQRPVGSRWIQLGLRVDF
jgi:hypothetical protein